MKEFLEKSQKKISEGMPEIPEKNQKVFLDKCCTQGQEKRRKEFLQGYQMDELFGEIPGKIPGQAYEKKSAWNYTSNT